MSDRRSARRMRRRYLPRKLRMYDAWWTLKGLLAKWFVCSIVGHKTITKMDGTQLCERH